MGTPAAAETVDVVVIGAGLSGIGMARTLRRSFPGLRLVILEARDAIGGTWDLFRYPGVRSDSDLHTYGFGFKPWTADDAIASGSAILRYLDEALDEGGLRPSVRFGHRVGRIVWSSDSARWTVEAEHAGTPVRFDCGWVVAATGYYRYDRGHEPDFADRDRFGGRIVHPQDWPADLDCAGRRVVVIGSGATAATIVPALAASAAHVTMLQRSPTYYAALPRQDRVANALRRWLPPERAYAWTRRKNTVGQGISYRLIRRFPRLARRMLIGGVARRLPAGYDVGRHFTPRYDPWDQRICLTPDGDLFAAISDGTVSVVTDTVAGFTANGVRTGSGTVVPADVVVTATGLELLALGGMEVVVDGALRTPGDCLVYKSAMLSGVPNLVFVFGYTNASWTLKVDLVGRWWCRVVAEQRRRGATTVVAVPTDPDMPTAPMLDFTSGYVERSVDRFPRQGTGPWSVAMDVRADRRRLLREPVADGILRFSGVAPAATTGDP